MIIDIRNTDNTIDSRDIIARIAELQSEQDDLIAEYLEAALEVEADPEGHPTDRICRATNELADYWNCDPEEAVDGISALNTPGDSFNGNEELHELKKLASQCENYGDWEHGEQLIADSYFAEYAEQLADDCCETPTDQHGNTIWPFTCIDWKKAADLLKQDYMEVTFDGKSYWMRSG